MIESWFWYQTSCFGRNFLKKILQIFFGLKKNFFGLGGPFWVPATPQYNEIGNFDKKLSISYKFYIRICKKKFVYRPLSRLQKFSKLASQAIFGCFCYFLAYLWHLYYGYLIFYRMATNFRLKCLRINKKNLGTRILRKGSWFLSATEYFPSRTIIQPGWVSSSLSSSSSSSFHFFAMG